MAQRKDLLEKDLVYHIYNRGINKNQLFFIDKDYERFFKTIEKYQNQFSGIKIFSYSVMSNHFHLMVMSKKSGKEISCFMQKIQQSYIMYLKTKYNDSDLLFKFQGRFKAKLVDNDEYFNKCLYYVNYNPIKHGIVEKIEDYPYTSIHQLSDKKKYLEKGIKIDYSLNGGLEEFFDDFEEFEF